MIEGSYWFRRVVKEAKRLSTHIRFKRIKGGFYRIYYRHAYIGECHKNMPEHGYDIYERGIGFENYEYYQQYHDNADSSLRIKNFVEGYWETKRRLKFKLYQFYHDPEFYKQALQGYSQMRVK